MIFVKSSIFLLLFFIKCGYSAIKLIFAHIDSYKKHTCININSSIKILTDLKERMFSRKTIQIVFLALARLVCVEGDHSQPATTCEEFERGARFNAYDIVDSQWKIIFFWSETTELKPIIFSLVDKKLEFRKNCNILRKLIFTYILYETTMFDIRVSKTRTKVKVPATVSLYRMSASLIFYKEKLLRMQYFFLICAVCAPNDHCFVIVPLLYQSLVFISGRPHPPPLLKLADLRFKLVDRYMGMMCCEDHTAFVLVRADEVPSTERECLDIASHIGFKGPGGRSYLYVKNLTRTEL
ncbi:uncharacterized protein LOC112049737 [Bicyclus anynana]|uniref:Uncharacterized protein LOC112049737 n=1 Tax=Bicyclus anynana TaxID=110368 RepID=A0ABM3M7R5_BICAN|nr:uncharacterized protein LOC112049737 [Bicyclus anynana]